MDLSKVKINSIAIKNYLFELNIVFEYTVEYIMVDIITEESKKRVPEAHFKVLTTDNILLDIHRDAADKLLYINDMVLNNWEDLENYLINIT